MKCRARRRERGGRIERKGTTPEKRGQYVDVRGATGGDVEFKSLKLPSRLKSLCRTVNGAKAPSSLVHTGTGPARLQVGWLSCLVFAFFFLSSVVWTHWSTFLL